LPVGGKTSHLMPEDSNLINFSNTKLRHKMACDESRKAGEKQTKKKGAFIKNKAGEKISPSCLR